LNHWVSRASVTDSPTLGTLISIVAMGFPFRNAAVHQALSAP
jgi:hypothetical protein